jgi:altronate hydrolase
MQGNCVKINEWDNVVIAIEAIKAGQGLTGVDGLDLDAAEDILKNHKVAIRRIEKGSPVIKYGEGIGLASKDIQPGQWVHTHNIKAEEEE